MPPSQPSLVDVTFTIIEPHPTLGLAEVEIVVARHKLPARCFPKALASKKHWITIDGISGGQLRADILRDATFTADLWVQERLRLADQRDLRSSTCLLRMNDDQAK